MLLRMVLILMLGLVFEVSLEKTPDKGEDFGYQLLASRLQSLENVYFNAHLKTIETIQDLRDEFKHIMMNLDDENTSPNKFYFGNKLQLFKTLPSSCDKLSSKRSGIYTINLSKGIREPFEVYCDQETFGGGWVVIQNRVKGNVNFYRPWNEYKHGFGSLDGDFWLGLDKIHEITYSDNYELAVLLQDYSGECAYARYDSFAVASEAEKYALNKLGTYTGNATDSLSYHLDSKFSTFDMDNDQHSTHCAMVYTGAWWYNACHYSNLNSIYPLESDTLEANKFMVWRKWKGDLNKLKLSRMMIRRKKSN